MDLLFVLAVLLLGWALLAVLWKYVQRRTVEDAQQEAGRWGVLSERGWAVDKHPRELADLVPIAAVPCNLSPVSRLHPCARRERDDATFIFGIYRSSEMLNAMYANALLLIRVPSAHVDAMHSCREVNTSVRYQRYRFKRIECGGVQWMIGSYIRRVTSVVNEAEAMIACIDDLNERN